MSELVRYVERFEDVLHVGAGAFPVPDTHGVALHPFVHFFFL